MDYVISLEKCSQILRAEENTFLVMITAFLGFKINVVCT